MTDSFATDDTQASPAGPDAEGFAELPRGSVVGHYLILGTLAVGGMGVVYTAYDQELDRKVALKMLRPAGHDDDGASEGRARLLREAQALARLAHPNVVVVHDVGTLGDRVWVAMELVAGRTIKAWARERTRRWPEVLQVITDVARGVAAAHAVGLVHRDLKPDNVMIDAEGRVRVMDFGLAHGRLAEAEPGGRASPARPEVEALALHLTRTGAMQGTPAYMAPEQWQGREAGPAADQFGWSVMAWELLYGERPFVGDSPFTLAARVLAGERRPPPRGRRAPLWLRRALERALASEPGRRWPSMAALLAALERGRARALARTVALVLLAVAVVGVGAEGLRRWDRARTVERCAATGADISAVWNDGARLAIREAFVASGLGHAATAADRAAPWLDRQTAAWTRARTGACLHAEVQGDWDADTAARAVACLDERRAALTSLVAELTRADPLTIQRAVSASAGQKSVLACLDVEQLRQRPTPPLQVRERAAVLQAALIRADALSVTGRWKAALELVTTTRAEAEALDWRPLVLAACERQSRLLAKTGDYTKSEVEGVETYFEAARLGLWDTADGAAIELTRTVGYLQGRHAEGRGWASHAAVVGALAGDAVGLREASRLDALAALQAGAGAYPEARALYERVLALREAALGLDHPDIATTLANLASAHHFAGDYAKARPLYERALARREALLGPDHPDVADNLHNLGGLLHATGATAEAEALLERALAIRQATLGPDHPTVGYSLQGVGALRYARGDYAGSAALAAQALALAERSHGPDHPDVAARAYSLATSRQALGAFTEARELYTRSLTIRERVFGPDHPDVAACLIGLASVDEATGKPTEAEAAYTRALAITKQAVGPDHPHIITIEYALAGLHHALGRQAEARALHRSAIAKIERTLGVDHPSYARSLVGLARVDIATGHAREAIASLERAQAIYAAHEGVQHDERASRFEMARALTAARLDPARARAEVIAARDGYRADGEGWERELAEVEAWLAKLPPERAAR